MEDEFLSIGHSFNAGDSLTTLAGLQEIAKKTGKKIRFLQKIGMPAYYDNSNNHPVKIDGVQVCMNYQGFKMMKPLMEAQWYISEYSTWKGEIVTYDYNLTRLDARIPVPGGDIHLWGSNIFPQLSCDLSKPWIKVKQKRFYGALIISEQYNIKSDFVILNFTERYRNPYIDYRFLKNYEKHLLFAGLECEHKAFCEKWELDIPRLFINNFLELAQVIAECKFGLMNQSMVYHIFEGMKKPRILEYNGHYPNCTPIGEDAHAFVAQGSVEYFVEQLMKK